MRDIDNLRLRRYDPDGLLFHYHVLFGSILQCARALGEFPEPLNRLQHFFLLLGILAVLTRRRPEDVVVEEPAAIPAEVKPESPWKYRSYV